MPHKDPAAAKEYRRQRYLKIKAGLHTPNPNQRTADDLTCSHCGKTFYRSPANRFRQGTGQYCSRECMALGFVGRCKEQHPRWRGEETRPCDACGAPVTRPRWTWNKRSLTFCNRGCFARWKSLNWTGSDNPSWNGGHPPYYGANWLRQQRKARQRDGHSCQFCGVNESALRRALDVHHIRPFRFFGLDNYKAANRLANLVSLCEQCHHHLEKFSESGLILDWPSLKAAALTRQSESAREPCSKPLSGSG